jgi:hypothetical protein
MQNYEHATCRFNGSSTWIIVLSNLHASKLHIWKRSSYTSLFQQVQYFGPKGKVFFYSYGHVWFAIVHDYISHIWKLFIFMSMQVCMGKGLSS